MRVQVLSGVLALALGVAAVQAAPAAANAKPAKEGAVADPAAEKDAKYDQASLVKQLTAMGYEAKVDGEMVNFTYKKGEDEYLLYFFFTEHNLMLSYVVTNKIKDIDKVPAPVWLKILEANEQYRPVHFALESNPSALAASHALGLRPIPNDRLDTVIKGFTAAIKATEPLWNEKAIPQEESK
jgi:hypothetical protein